jgi:hypothetical protein
MDKLIRLKKKFRNTVSFNFWFILKENCPNSVKSELLRNSESKNIQKRTKHKELSEFKEFIELN